MLLPMTVEMYRCYDTEYENDPDIYMEGQELSSSSFLPDSCAAAIDIRKSPVGFD